MSHDEVRRINEALVGLPLVDRLAALVVSFIEPDNDNVAMGPEAVAILIHIAMIMTKHLPIEQRVSVAWHLAEAASELEVKNWN